MAKQSNCTGYWLNGPVAPGGGVNRHQPRPRRRLPRRLRFGWRLRQHAGMTIRDETPADWEAIDRVNREAFGGEEETRIVRRLRADGLAAASLVAEEDGAVVGHLMLSWLPTVVDGRSVRAAALAPMAVLPGHQRRGIGSRLVAAGIAAARRIGVEAIVVVGHPEYYPRFGFSAAAAAHLSAPFSGAAFMALEIVPRALKGTAGSVDYPAAFGLE
jgi:putative acetyltransferase